MSEYTENVDWGIYLDQHRQNNTGCASCMERCDTGEQCSSVECGNDQELLDGTVIKAHCSYWYNGFCERAHEFNLNPSNTNLTCKKIKTGMFPFLTNQL